MDKLSVEDLENAAKWEYNSFFLDTIIPALNYMIDEGHSHPAGMTSEQWNKILGEIKWGFEILQKEVKKKGWDFLKKFSREDQIKIDRSFDLFKEHFFNLSD